jgi:hypothetical protein
LKWIFSSKETTDEDDECGECTKPKKTCGCSEPKKFKEPITCPAKGGMKMGDQCGISRFT